MKLQRKSALIIFYVMVSLTTSKAMNILREDNRSGPSREITENPAKNFLDRSALSAVKDGNMDGQTIREASVQAVADNETASTMKNSIIESEMLVENPTYDTMNNPVDFDFGDDPANDFADDPEIISIPPEAIIFSMEVREFHECVSCNADNGARKYYNECLQKLSLKNQENIKSCCNVSFDNDFCNQASTGKINYKTICKESEKALVVGDCFWRKIENMEADDIKMYRQCKNEILLRYCTPESSSDIILDMENDQVLPDMH